MTKAKMPGLLQDPWRASVPEPPPRRNLESVEPPPGVPTISADASPIHDDLQDPKHATIELKGYGGITVDGVDELTHAASQVLQFCIDHQATIDDTLLQYGVLVAKVPVTRTTTKFYVQRKDGWMLAVPDANSRDEGCLQLIQAMLEIYRLPKMKKTMRKYRIRPYKM